MKSKLKKMRAPREDGKSRDRTRDRDGWKAARTNARKAKSARRTFEDGKDS